MTLLTPVPTELLWQPAQWEDYERQRDSPTETLRERHAVEAVRLFFFRGLLRTERMGWEGILHAEVNHLFTLLLGLWFMAHPEQQAQLLGGCLLEKLGEQAAAPDLVLYVGDHAPQWQVGEPRRIALNQWRVPDLVGEVADTTLATDLDEMKQLYAAMGIPEYWVIDVQGGRIWAFRLGLAGRYEPCRVSEALPGLLIDLLEQALGRLDQGTNIAAAQWFMSQIHIKP